MKTPPEVLELDLARHCIETAVRQRCERAMRTCFRQPAARPQLEPAIERLHQALQTLDFGLLRSRHPALAGGTPSRVTMAWDPRDRLTIAIDDQPLEDLPHK